MPAREGFHEAHEITEPGGGLKTHQQVDTAAQARASQNRHATTGTGVVDG
jgi:hypothetical protein